jgi:UDP-N-acetylglucosamine:LPS N-acetylglucosamine transferase
VLIISASMGAGHDGAAAELARRLIAAGAVAEVCDLLVLLPLGLGDALRGWYAWMMRSAPWLYELIYRTFFALAPRSGPEDDQRAIPAAGRREGVWRGSRVQDWPLTVLVAECLRRLVLHRRPDEVVSVFHLAAQATGLLRETGRLNVPSTVLITDFAVHRMWLHPGNDRYLCPSQATARRVAALTGRPAAGYSPLTRPSFQRPVSGALQAPMARALRRSSVRPVLISSGSWGVGEVAETAQVLACSGRYLPIILCGGNERLRRRLDGLRPGLVLGWRDDLPALMAGAYALVDNAAGLICREAFAAGLPVVSYRPIPGHGRDGVLAMARDGLSLHAQDPAGLISVLDRLAAFEVRARQVAAGTALFDEPSAEALLLDRQNGAVPGAIRSPGP